MASALECLRTSLARNRDKKVGLEEQLRLELELVRRHESDIEKYKHYTYTVEEQVVEIEETEPGVYMTNCITCNMTCHGNCCPLTDHHLDQCPAMDDNGCCKMCPMNCHWSMHKNQPFVYVVQSYTVTKTSDELKRRYEDAMQKKAEAETVVASRSKELEKVNNEIKADETKLVGCF